ncbi:MAG: hypothetical protein ACTSUB_02635 [Candidatus Thorarchaeota archaeon]
MDSIDEQERTSLPMDIDRSNSAIITELNNLGLYILMSCSGLDDDNEQDEIPWNPFVTIDVESPLSFYHVFTIADMAGWESNYGIDGLGIELRLNEMSQEETRIRWDLLLDSAKIVIQRIQILGKNSITAPTKDK